MGELVLAVEKHQQLCNELEKIRNSKGTTNSTASQTTPLPTLSSQTQASQTESESKSPDTDLLGFLIKDISRSSSIPTSTSIHADAINPDNSATITTASTNKAKEFSRFKSGKLNLSAATTNAVTAAPTLSPLTPISSTSIPISDTTTPNSNTTVQRQITPSKQFLPLTLSATPYRQQYHSPLKASAPAMRTTYSKRTRKPTIEFIEVKQAINQPFVSLSC